MSTIQFQFEIGSTPSSVVFQDPANGFGVRRTDNNATVVNAGVALTGAGGNLYTYTFADPADGLTYEYYIKVVVGSNTFFYHLFVGGAGSAKTFSFCAVKDGALVDLSEVPTLENPAATFGAIDLATGEVVIDAGTEFVEGGSQWEYSLGRSVDDADHQYRYYVKAVLDGTVWYLPRTTEFVSSAMLAIGRYTDSHRIEQQFGVDDVHKWLGIDDKDDAVDYALRANQFIIDAEAELDDLLRGSCDVPFTTTIPPIITNIATALAGVRMYEARGVMDMNKDTGQVQHRLQFQSKWADKEIGRIKSGQMKLSTDTARRYPGVL